MEVRLCNSGVASIDIAVGEHLDHEEMLVNCLMLESIDIVYCEHLGENPP